MKGERYGSGASANGGLWVTSLIVNSGRLPWRLGKPTAAFKKRMVGYARVATKEQHSDPQADGRLRPLRTLPTPFPKKARCSCCVAKLVPEGWFVGCAAAFGG